MLGPGVAEAAWEGEDRQTPFPLLPRVSEDAGEGRVLWQVLQGEGELAEETGDWSVPSSWGTRTEGRSPLPRLGPAEGRRGEISRAVREGPGPAHLCLCGFPPWSGCRGSQVWG